MIENERQQKEWDHNNELLNITGNTTYTWRSASAKEKWSPILTYSGLGIMDDVEFYQMLRDDTDRDVKIIHFSHRNRHDLLRRIAEHELYYREIKEIERFDGFSQSHTSAADDDPRRVSYSVISPDEDAADDVQYAELNLQGEEKHRIIGERLGFPDCCISYLTDSYSQEGSYPEHMYHSASQSTSAEPIGDMEYGIKLDETDIHIGIPVWRNTPFKIITHSPHSFSCEDSQRIAEERLESLEKAGQEEVVELLREWYNEPFIWEIKNGIETIQNKYLKVQTTGHHTTEQLRIEGGDISKI